MKDLDKLLIIAQTYSYTNGRFSARQLYDFIQLHNYRFHSDYTTRQIGRFLKKNKKFTSFEGQPVKYEAI